MGGGAVPGARWRLAEQPVRLLHHGQVAQPRQHRAFGAGPHPQKPGQPQQHSARYECFIPVIAAVFDLQHHVRTQQRTEIQRMPAAQEPPGRAQPQRPDPDPHEAPHIVGDLPPVPDLFHHGHRRGLQIRQRRVPRPVHGSRAGDQVPARLLIAAGQRGGQHLRERFVRLEAEVRCSRLEEVGVRERPASA